MTIDQSASLKKLIGKKPRSYEEILKACPKRAAAQNAQHTIRSRSKTQLRQERKLQQLIRDKGIVSDHFKQQAAVSQPVKQETAAQLNCRKNIMGQARKIP